MHKHFKSNITSKFAFQKACSGKDLVLALNETIHFYNERGNNVYVVFLDVAKAVDSVWQDGLFYELHEIGWKSKFWKILKESYANFKCEVLLNSKRSKTFTTEKGVYQGAPLSMRLYQIYNNDLLESLIKKSSIFGIFFILNLAIRPLYCG